MLLAKSTVLTKNSFMEKLNKYPPTRRQYPFQYSIMQLESLNFHSNKISNRDFFKKKSSNLCQPPQCKGWHFPQLYIIRVQHLNQRSNSTPLYNVNLQTTQFFNFPRKEKKVKRTKIRMKNHEKLEDSDKWASTCQCANINVFISQRDRRKETKT